MHPASEPPARRSILETTVVVLMAVVLLGMAFLFWNQALLLERLNHSQDMLKDLHAWVQRERPAAAPAPSSTAFVTTPPLPASSRFPSDLSSIESPPLQPAVTAVRVPPEPESPVAPVRIPTVVEKPPALPAARPEPAPAPRPEKEPALAEAPPVLSDVSAPEPRVQVPAENPIPPAPAAVPPPALPEAAPAAPALSADPGAILWQEYGPVITRVISDLYAGRYDQVTSQFTPAFSQHMPKTLLSYTMDRDRGRYGNFRKVLGYKVVDEPQLEQEDQKAFRVTVDTDKSQILVFTITLTGQKQINGLFFKALPVQTSSN